MTGFQGRAHIKIDPKGRIHLPTSFARAFQKNKGVVITNAIFRGNKFLDMYSLNEWQKLEARIARLPQMKAEIQTFQRFYLSSGERLEMDAQARFVIPAHLRDYAELKEDAVLVGMGAKIELWSQKKWQAAFNEMGSSFDQIMSVIADLDEKRR